MTWLAMHLLKTLHVLPLAVVRAIGALLGAVLYALAAERRRVANATEARQMMEAASLQRGILLQVQSATGGTNFVLLQARD